jgi:hypothetical protein
MIGMTPAEHAARAAELIAEAERLYQICLVDYETNINEDDHSEEPYVPGADLAMLTATTQLAQAHAVLAQLAPSYVPGYGHATPDGDRTPYGDGEPTY